MTRILLGYRALQRVLRKLGEKHFCSSVLCPPEEITKGIDRCRIVKGLRVVETQLCGQTAKASMYGMCFKV